MHCGERGEERGSGDFNVRGLAGKTALRNSIGACRAPAASHISHRASSPEVGVLWRILPTKRVHQSNGGGGVRKQALPCLRCSGLWASETTVRGQEGTMGECWKSCPRQHPQSIPRGCRGPVLGIPGQGGSSSHFWFWSCFAGFKFSFTLWNCPELLEGSCPGTNPSFSGCHPCSLRLPDLCSERGGSESGQLLAMTGGTGPPHTSARGLGALCQASPVRS